MKKFILILLVLTLGLLAACGNKEEANAEEGLTKVKVGVSGGDTRTWDYIVDISKDQGLDIELVTFNDYVQPNIALDEGELDANAFQTISYFDEFKTAQSLDLEAIGSTVIAPMAIHSKKHKTLEDLPDGATIALPNEGTNFGRALLLMQEAGLITLTDDFVGIGAMDKIKDNPKNLKIEAVAAGNTPRFLDDVDASIINNNFAIEADLELKEALFHESATAKPYINIIAVKTGDSDRPELQKLVEIYHSKEVEEFIIEKYKGSSIPTFVSLEELLNYKDSWK
ncbi:MetQ/NlpA family ABC transporter substrate-binding protein [Paenisporosarcina sp. TG-14]|uniref:MetQ/NlpA family ABC transporter substrate-binding protein n=1 Tax=Paenisporosarcina sp. TG-14 TaxID=1231057 RepID=UPI000318D122|nr:MetQ/NlpA family ABC transporter substrate-binding protein [Paenisporosarcina sp. TG-14]